MSLTRPWRLVVVGIASLAVVACGESGPDDPGHALGKADARDSRLDAVERQFDVWFTAPFNAAPRSSFPMGYVDARVGDGRAQRLLDEIRSIERRGQRISGRAMHIKHFLEEIIDRRIATGPAFDLLRIPEASPSVVPMALLDTGLFSTPEYVIYGVDDVLYRRGDFIGWDPADGDDDVFSAWHTHSWKSIQVARRMFERSVAGLGQLKVLPYKIFGLGQVSSSLLYAVGAKNNKWSFDACAPGVIGEAEAVSPDNPLIDAVAMSIRDARARGVRVVAMPFGASCTAGMYRLIKRSTQMAFVTSAGNDAKDMAEVSQWPARFRLDDPAMDNLIVVGALVRDRSGALGLHDLSNHGHGVDVYVNGQFELLPDESSGVGPTSTSRAAVSLAAVVQMLSVEYPQLQVGAILRAIRAVASLQRIAPNLDGRVFDVDRDLGAVREELSSLATGGQ